jgi:hypothetical protein
MKVDVTETKEDETVNKSKFLWLLMKVKKWLFFWFLNEI